MHVTKALQALALSPSPLEVSSSIYKSMDLFKFSFSHAYNFYSKDLDDKSNTL